MNTPALGYPKDLLMLPFDHRGYFEAGLLSIRGRRADHKSGKPGNLQVVDTP